MFRTAEKGAEVSKRGEDLTTGPSAEATPESLESPISRTSAGASEFIDGVTVLEIGSPDQGGVWEKALPGDRSAAPPSPPEAPRMWVPSFRRRAAYVVLGLALVFILGVLLLQAVRLG